MGFANIIDSLLAIKYIVFDKRICKIKKLVEAVKANWKGYEFLRMITINKAVKYGQIMTKQIF